MKIGIIKEGKNPPDKRVPLSPSQCAQIIKAYPSIEIFVETSNIRCFNDQEYLDKGIPVIDSVNSCDVLMGVKEVPKANLIPNKKYFFFSHTIKKQPYNKDLLRKILKEKIQLIDYECLSLNGRRLIGFGRYAGIVGAYTGILAYGKRTNTFEIKPANMCFDRKELEKELEKIILKDIKIVLTGNGRVAHGVMEILNFLNIQKLSPKEFLTYKGEKSVYTQLKVTDYNKRVDGVKGSISGFFKDPTPYESDFMKYAICSDIYIAGHYWDSNSPYIYTREDAKSDQFNISVVADISCDIDGPVASTIRPSTIAEPLYGYNPFTESETNFNELNSITVMAVDNLPCELPRDASEDFGSEFISKILPSLINDKEAIIQNASITNLEGRLNKNYTYLQEWVESED